MEVTSGNSNANQKSQSMQASEAPMDFLQRLFSGKPEKAKSTTNSEVVDLSLSLSLGGSYGQNGEQKSLTRSSTIAGDITQRTVTNGSLGGYSGVRLEKSCSLPAKADNVLMRFGDLQTMRRAETRRRLLLEKQRRAAAKAAEKEKAPVAPSPPTMDVPHKAAAYAAASAYKSSVSAYKSPVLNFAMNKTKSADSNHEGLNALAKLGGSSMVPTSSKQAFMVPAAPASKEKPPRPAAAGTTSENANKKVRFCNPGTGSFQGDSTERLKKMPSVRTTGDGPNGRRIEGILYKYVKDEVWIVCVCHGRFFSPAGFVKHAGGGDVENPMRRITVCPGSF